MSDSDKHGILRAALRSLPRLEPDAMLRTRLRIIGSRHALSRRRRSNPAAALRECLEWTGVWFNNLVRPYAMPMTGGLLSSMVLFGMLVPTIQISEPQLGAVTGVDVPTRVATEASLAGSFAFGMAEGEDIVLDVKIGNDGRMIEYSLSGGQQWTMEPELRRSVENMLLCTRFNPATLFGQPLPGRTRIGIHRSRVEVRG